MTTIVKAFVEVTPLIDNAAGQVNAIGELSYARSYSTDITTYHTASRSDYIVNVFICERDGMRIKAPQSVVDKITEVTENIRTVFDGSVNGRQWLENNHEELEEIVSGEIIVEQDETWLSKFGGKWDDDGEEIRLEVFYSQEQMRDDYEPFEVRVTPPISPITSLYTGYENAFDALIQVTPTTRTALEESVRAGTNFTMRRTFELTWQDPSNPTKQMTTYWTILCYGPRANRIDNILEAIRQYLTDNSEYTVDQWKEYFPDLLTVENFTLMPFWEQTALTAGERNHSVYSPIVRIENIGEFAKKYLPSYQVETLLEKGEVATHVWRGLQFFIMPGTGNPIERERFSLVYPDYAVLNINDQNAQRISKKTRNAMEGIEKLARLALEYEQGKMELPNDINEIYQDGIMYLEKPVDGISLRVLTYEAYRGKQ